MPTLKKKNIYDSIKKKRKKKKKAKLIFGVIFTCSPRGKK